MSDELVARAEWIHERVALLEVYFFEQRAVALYLVEGARTLLVDSGAADTPERALHPALAKIGRRLEDIDVIVNTHAHMEHAWGNGGILALASAEVLMHEAEVPLLDPLPQLESVIRHLAKLGAPSEAEQAQQEVQRQRAAASPLHVPPPHRTIRDGDLIDLGDGVQLRVMHTPGHSPGSICLYWESEQILFTGDSVTGSPDSSWFYFEDARAHRDSLERIQRLPVQLLCPAHRYSYRPPHPAVLDPVRRGADATRFVSDSLLSALDLEACALEALRAQPTASRLVQADDGLRRLERRLGSTLQTDVPWPRVAAALWLEELSGPR